MSKLTLDAATRHQRACELLALGRQLTFDERLYVLTHYQESATTVNTTIGAYFTPMRLADDEPPKKPYSLEKATGIVLEPRAGVDTTEYRDEWRGVAPTVEIVTADFDEARERRQAALW